MTNELTRWRSKTVDFGAIVAGADIEKALQNRPIHQDWDDFLLKVVSVKKVCAALDYLQYANVHVKLFETRARR